MSDGPDHDIDDLFGRLRSAGVRLTVPRRAVIEALVAHDGHPTADDLASSVSERAPEVHRSTVYRTLDALAELGLVSHVHLGHGRAVYHLSGDDDIHLLCDGCESVTHVSASVLGDARSAIEASTGFQIEPGHFALPGLCRLCRS